MTMDEDYLKHIDRLIQQRPVARPALESYRELARLMVHAEPSPKVKRPEPACSEIGKNEGFPAFQRQNLPVDFAWASRLLSRFFKHLGQTGREDQPGFDDTLKKFKTGPHWGNKLLNAILQQDETGLNSMSKEVGLDPGVLLFLGKTALRPSLMALGCLMEKDMENEPWEKGYCPLCGSEPDMACFTKTGKRLLQCELCGKQWAFARIACPFCNNREQRELGYLEAEGEEGLRIYFCKSCLRYLKTVDSRAFEEVAPLELESLATLHLDLIAGQNGYK